MEMDIIKANLKAAFEKPGCPICRLHQEAEIAYVQTLLYEYVNDGFTRLGFVHSQGLCSHHAWLLQACEQSDWGDGLKTAIIYESVASLVHKSLIAYLEGCPPESELASPPVRKKESRGWHRWRAQLRAVFARWLMRRPSAPSSANRLLVQLAPRAECPICEAIQGKEALMVAKLAHEILDLRFWAALRASDGLCLPHLRKVLACSPKEEATHLIVKMADEKLTPLLAHLRGYIDKHRWQDRGLLYPEEKAAWVRTVAFFAGEAREDRSTDMLRAMRQAAMEEYSQRTRQERDPGKVRMNAAGP
jgi:hypothetical protein